MNIYDYVRKVEKIPDNFLDFVNQRIESELEKEVNFLMKKAIITSDPKILKEFNKKCSMLDKEEEKQENRVKSNPLKYASMMKYSNGEDLLIDRETFLRIMRHFPLDFWINGKPPYESPIAARLNSNEIIVMPYEENAKITGIHANFSGDLFFAGMNICNEEMVGKCLAHPTYTNGCAGFKLSFNPTKYGTGDYNIKRTNELITKENDCGAGLMILLEHVPHFLTENCEYDDVKMINYQEEQRKKMIRK